VHINFNQLAHEQLLAGSWFGDVSEGVADVNRRFT